MKQRLVVWAENAQDEKELIAIELKPEKNSISIVAIPANMATEDLYKDLMEKWRKGEEVPFPSGHRNIERPLEHNSELAS